MAIVRSKRFAATSSRAAGSSRSFFLRLIAPSTIGRPVLAGRGHVLVAQDLLHQLLLVVGVVDDEAAVDPDRLAVAAQDPGAERVERAGLHVAAGVADEADDPLPQLGRGPVGEGHRQDLPRPDALDADEVGDAVGEDTRLAAAGAGEDQQRALGRRDRARLLRD